MVNHEDAAFLGDQESDRAINFFVNVCHARQNGPIRQPHPDHFFGDSPGLGKSWPESSRINTQSWPRPCVSGSNFLFPKVG